MAAHISTEHHLPHRVEHVPASLTEFSRQWDQTCEEILQYLHERDTVPLVRQKVTAFLKELKTIAIDTSSELLSSRFRNLSRENVVTLPDVVFDRSDDDSTMYLGSSIGSHYTLGICRKFIDFLCEDFNGWGPVNYAHLLNTKSIIVHEIYHLYQLQKYESSMHNDHSKPYSDRRGEFAANLYQKNWIRDQRTHTISQFVGKRIILWIINSELRSTIERLSGRPRIR